MCSAVGSPTLAALRASVLLVADLCQYREPAPAGDPAISAAGCWLLVAGTEGGTSLLHVCLAFPSPTPHVCSGAARGQVVAAGPCGLAPGSVSSAGIQVAVVPAALLIAAVGCPTVA